MSWITYFTYIYTKNPHLTLEGKCIVSRSRRVLCCIYDILFCFNKFASKLFKYECSLQKFTFFFKELHLLMQRKVKIKINTLVSGYLGNHSFNVHVRYIYESQITKNN